MPPPATSPIRSVAVVVLTWNGLADTLACLHSVAAIDWPGLNVIVSDNASTDGTAQHVRAAGLAGLVIENRENLGFAGGNNVGIDAALAAGADAILLLNNDTVVPPAAVRTLVQVLDERPLAGACSPVLTFSSEPTRLWFAGSPFDPQRGRAGRASLYERGVALPAAPFEIDRATGAAVLVRRQVVEDVGALDSDLFFLYEDVDWSLRMRDAGWRILLTPDVRVAHRVAASQNGHPVTPTTAYYGTRNDLEIGHRYGPHTRLGATRRQAGCILVHLAQLRRAPAGARIATFRATLAGVLDYRRRRFGRRAAG
jgi:GT2 family glycosyltransferase